MSCQVLDFLVLVCFGLMMKVRCSISTWYWFPAGPLCTVVSLEASTGKPS